MCKLAVDLYYKTGAIRAHGVACFIAGMREGAKVAAIERLSEPQTEGDEAYELAITHVVDAIRKQADELEGK